jgi:hypothetical protein
LTLIPIEAAFATWRLSRFTYSLDGKLFEVLGDTFKAQPGMWIGAKVGLFSLASAGATEYGHAEYDWFRFKPQMTLMMKKTGSG